MTAHKEILQLVEHFREQHEAYLNPHYLEKISADTGSSNDDNGSSTAILTSVSTTSKQ